MFASVGTGLVVGGVARLLPMIGVVNKLGELSKMKDAATALNMTAEGASGLFGVLAAMGGDFKEDLEGITQFSARIRDAIAGVGGPTGEAARLFEGLSISAKDLEGVPLDEAFLRVHAAIRELPQELQASRLSLVGGTDSMKKWLPLLARSNAEIRAQAKALSSSKEDMDEAQAATLAYKDAMVQLGLVWRRVAVALAGVVEVVSKWSASVLGPLAETVRQNKALIIGFVAASAATVALGAAFIGAGMAITGAVTTVGAITAAVSFLLTPVGLAVAAVAALAAGFAYLTGVGGTLRATFAGVSDALAAGDMQLAWSIGLAGMRLEWAKLVEVLTVGWNDFKSFFVDGWHDAVYLVRQLMSGLTTFVAKRMVDAAAAISRNLGGAFEAVGMANPFRFLEENAGDVKRILDEMGRDEELAMHRRFQREQAARGAARAADAAAAAGAVAAAEKERRDLMVTAAFRRMFRGGAAGTGAGAGGVGAEVAAALGAIRGGFAGFGSLASQFGGAGPNREVVKRLDKIVEKTDEEIGVMEEVARQLGNVQGSGLIWGV